MWKVVQRSVASGQLQRDVYRVFRRQLLLGRKRARQKLLIVRDRLPVTAKPVTGLGQIKRHVLLRWIGFYRPSPRVDRGSIITEPLREYSQIDQRIGIARKMPGHLFVVFVGFFVALVL